MNAPGGRRGTAAVAAVLAFLAPACGGRDSGSLPAAEPAPMVTSAPVTEPAAIAPPPVEPQPSVSPSSTPIPRTELRRAFPLAIGSSGRAVAALQRELTARTYDPGPVDGRFGPATIAAVYAFEKVAGWERDGVVGRKEMRAIMRSTTPEAPRRAPDDFVDVDITRQVLFEVRDGRVVHTLAVSTGNGATYSSTSGWAVAHTPRGAFEIGYKIPGWRVGYLGAMYYPSYFYGGYAIHGSSSVPPYPASHGCVRIPMHSTIGFFERNPVGTAVFVHD